ncbi:MAG: DUF4388 domain-containing protein [Myxococcota bacterium]
MVCVLDPYFAEPTAQLGGISTTVVADAVQALEQLAARNGVDLIVTDTAPAGPLDCLHFILQARTITPSARLLMLKPDHFVHVTDNGLGVTRFASRHHDPTRVEGAALALLSANDRPDGPPTLENMELLDLVQLAHLARCTAVLHIRHQKSKGLIGFHNGELVHAQHGELQGEEALHVLLALHEGDIVLQQGGDLGHITLRKPWPELAQGLATAILEQRSNQTHTDASSLDEAITESDVSDLLGMDDTGDGSLHKPMDLTGGEPLFSAAELMEMGELSSADSSDHNLEIPVDTSVPLEQGLAMISSSHVAVPDQGLPMEPAAQPLNPYKAASPAEIRFHGGSAPQEMSGLGKRLHTLLEQFCEEIPEFLATDLVHRDDGLSVGGMMAVDDYDSTVAGAFYSDVFNTCHRAIFGFGLDEGPEELLVTTSVAYILIRAVGHTPFMHLMMMHRTGNLGIARVVMRRYGPLFAELLPSQ